MFTSIIGRIVGALRDSVARILILLRIKPNQLTVAGLFVSLTASVFLAQGMFMVGAGFLVVAGAMDMLDGAVAKLDGQKTRFGAFLDSMLDRYSDSAIFASLIYYYAGSGHGGIAVIASLALVAAILISYSRARAEAFMERCDVGFWERGERLGLIIAGAVCNRMLVVLLMLATLPHLTVLQRIRHTHLKLRRDKTAGAPEGKLGGWWRPFERIVFWNFERGSIPYDIVMILLAVVFILFRDDVLMRLLNL